MAKLQKREASVGTAKKKDRGLEQLLKGVSVDAFVNMVSKSGLPTEESRELCAQFKALK